MFPRWGTHITRDMCFPGGGTHITRDMCFPGKGTHITRDMCFSGGEVNRRNSLRSYRYTQTPLHGLKLNTETSQKNIDCFGSYGLLHMDSDGCSQRFLSLVSLAKETKLLRRE